MKRKAIIEHEPLKNQPPLKKRKIIKKNLIYLLTRIKKPHRLHCVFKSIFEFYNHEDESFIKDETIYYKFENIIVEFCNLILQSKGEFILADDSVFLFEDRRFFFPLYFMTPTELKIIINLLKVNKLKINPKFKNTKMFETIPIKFKLDTKYRLKLIYSYLRHLSDEVYECFIDCKYGEVEGFQYKIILCTKIIQIINHIASVYNLNLSRNINIFKNIIKKVKFKYRNKNI